MASKHAVAAIGDALPAVLSPQRSRAPELALALIEALLDLPSDSYFSVRIEVSVGGVHVEWSDDDDGVRSVRWCVS